uniref:Uncharacterized protein n=1 Tax=Rhizophora mucronata TaxID=61149 RepID=A0A2P2JIU7_RHIMU
MCKLGACFAHWYFWMDGRNLTGLARFHGKACKVLLPFTNCHCLHERVQTNFSLQSKYIFFQ